MATSADTRLLALIGDVLGLVELPDLREGVLLALDRAVPSDWVSINEIGPTPADMHSAPPTAVALPVADRSTRSSSQVTPVGDERSSAPGAPNARCVAIALVSSEAAERPERSPAAASVTRGAGFGVVRTSGRNASERSVVDRVVLAGNSGGHWPRPPALWLA